MRPFLRMIVCGAKESSQEKESIPTFSIKCSNVQSNFQFQKYLVLLERFCKKWNREQKISFPNAKSLRGQKFLKVRTVQWQAVQRSAIPSRAVQCQAVQCSEDCPFKMTHSATKWP